MSNQTPYIGSKISLISKLDIRYEGILYSVNTTESTLALVKVCSLGTEDRPVSNPVPARDDVYEHIIFRAADIKDLVICETTEPQTLGGLPYDPAIVSVSNNAPGAEGLMNLPRGDTPSEPVRGSYQPQRTGYNNQGYNRGHNGSQPLMGRGRDMFHRNQYQNHRANFRFDRDYDFEKANGQFEEILSNLLKDATISEKKGENEEIKPDEATNASEEDGEAFYDKTSSFFDRISCDVLEKAEGQLPRRPDWTKEREMNQETFGHRAVRALNYRRGFGRGCGGPRNGGGRYNNGYNNYNNGGYYRGYGGGNRDGFRRNNQQAQA